MYLILSKKFTDIVRAAVFSKTKGTGIFANFELADRWINENGNPDFVYQINFSRDGEEYV